eukprot:TRINITY_DN8699_c0_g1_i1.p1 TRINITY_DN8699_c0_g1~~TRINITY_DN8699_c0_g1_i1.p1  ORF type:complete len:229 (-),score=76.11 TRINITY_DN8699_c0_g1_i1:28-714(-)
MGPRGAKAGGKGKKDDVHDSLKSRKQRMSITFDPEERKKYLMGQHNKKKKYKAEVAKKERTERQEERIDLLKKQVANLKKAVVEQAEEENRQAEALANDNDPEGDKTAYKSGLGTTTVVTMTSLQSEESLLDKEARVRRAEKQFESAPVEKKEEKKAAPKKTKKKSNKAKSGPSPKAVMSMSKRKQAKLRKSNKKQQIGRHTSELQSHSFISYAVFCLKKKKKNTNNA